jgi:hypothetical protein
MIKSNRFLAEFMFRMKNPFEFSDRWLIIAPGLAAADTAKPENKKRDRSRSLWFIFNL